MDELGEKAVEKGESIQYKVDKPCIMSFCGKNKQGIMDVDAIIEHISKEGFSVIANSVYKEELQYISVVFLDTRSAYVTIAGKVVQKQLCGNGRAIYWCSLERMNQGVRKYVSRLERQTGNKNGRKVHLC